MTARFLIRFDDICPTMNWTAWARIEEILNKHSIKPILAVVPDNRDSNLEISDARPDFWEQVRTWQEWGWTIGMHGYQHVYRTGEAGLIGLNKRSEFAGLSRDQQEAQIASGLEIFQREAVRPTVWVAPGHSFDETTVSVLQSYGIAVISDGFFLRPVRFCNSIWIPQQLWRFRPFLFGLWTVCYHHNKFDENNIAAFEKDVHRYSPNLVSLDQLVSPNDVQNIILLDRQTAAA